MRHITNALAGFTLVVLLNLSCHQSPVRAEFCWSAEPAVILPRPAGLVDLDEVGIADTAFLLQGNLLGSVRKTIRNLYGDPFPPGSRYAVRVTLESYEFRKSLPYDVGFKSGGITILDSLIKGPLPILEGSQATFMIRFNRDLPCGLFKLSCRIDSTGRYIEDAHFADNLYEDFIFVPGKEPFDVQWLTPDTLTIYASAPPASAFSLKISSGDPGETEVIYADMEVRSPLGSTATSSPVRGMRFPELPAVVDIAVQPSTARIGAVEEMTILLRFFSGDGGSFRQKKARVRILHDK